MFTITEAAQNQIATFFNDRELKPVRVFLHEGGCGGPQIAMGLDEKRDNDEVYEFAGVEYVIDKDFLAKAQPVQVDFGDRGFEISSPMELGDGGCGGCGSGSSCCSH